MASKVIGFRLPEDMVEELEKVCEERGLTVAEFLRSLVDETLYPSTELHDDDDDKVTREEIEILTNAHKDLTIDVKELRMLIDRVGTKIAGYELDGILNPKTAESLREIEKIKNTVNNLDNKVGTLSIHSKTNQDVVKYLDEYNRSSDRSYADLQKQINSLQSQQGVVSNLSSKVKQLESEVAQIKTDTTLIKRDIKRKPTDEIHVATYKDGSEHKFRMYESTAGLTKPHRVVLDPSSGNKYIDLTEPLN